MCIRDRYHVDKLTVAMNVSYTGAPPIPFNWAIVKFEGSLEQFKKYYWNLTYGNPNCTQWLEVNPNYSRQWHLISWIDNGDQMLGSDDYVFMMNKQTGEAWWLHIEWISTDMWLSQKIICTDWHELHPTKSPMFHISSWEPGVVLSPGDQIDMTWTDPATGTNITEWFEVDDVTVDLTVMDLDTRTIRHLDYKCGYWMFKKDVWQNPNCSKWNEIKLSLIHI